MHDAMTKWKILALAILQLAALTATAQTDLYNRYASRTDIRVASVTNFTLSTSQPPRPNNKNK